MSTSSSLPVVWCADRNSVDNKPTAFALQGIHLQGNISEQHVLAVRELINAASEGRLLLPADGGVVVVSCGAGIGSLIVSSDEKKRVDESNKNKGNCDVKNISNNKGKFKTVKKSIQNKETSSELLYEFLCCARCMNEGTKCNNRTKQNTRIIERYLDAKINAGRAMRRCVGSHYNNKSLKLCHRKNKNSFKADKRSVKRFQSSNASSCIPFPIYATINKRNKLTSRENKATKVITVVNKSMSANDIVETVDVVQFSSEINESFRKTSFDSTYTISSMDSGFIEMQNKIEIAREALKSQSSIESIQIKIESSPSTRDFISEELAHQSIDSTNDNSWNRLTIPQQSRNRRKSYEEFKSLFCDYKHLTSVEAKSLCKSRRKSYEEFKSTNNLQCDYNNSNETVQKNYLKADETSQSFFSRIRRGSKRFSQKNVNVSNNKKTNQEEYHSKNFEVGELKTIYDILRKNDHDSKHHLETNIIRKNYDKNLELFENHCIKNQHSLKSCGAIYDIIQKRSDIYMKAYKKYDKYMTYGTLYEILHRKSDEGDQFDRKRTFSEKYTNKQRINYDIVEKSSSSAPLENHNGFKKLNNSNSVTDLNENNLNSSSTSANVSGSLKQGSCNTNNQLSITSVNGNQLSTIYDILQTKKLDTNTSIQPNKNRFLVRKITEEELFEFQKENNNKDTCEIKSSDTHVLDRHEINVAINTEEGKIEAINDHIIKKQKKLRRFSNILSYSPKVSNEFEVIRTPPTSDLVEAKIDEVYSLLNRNTLQASNEKQKNQSSLKQKNLTTNGLIYKSNSLDMLSTADENQEFSIKQKPFRKISVPVNLPPKILPKKNTRRISEFTRGEFLNEKL